jgi:hypothetical protein
MNKKLIECPECGKKKAPCVIFMNKTSEKLIDLIIEKLGLKKYEEEAIA